MKVKPAPPVYAIYGPENPDFPGEYAITCYRRKPGGAVAGARRYAGGPTRESALDRLPEGALLLEKQGPETWRLVRVLKQS